MSKQNLFLLSDPPRVNAFEDKIVAEGDDVVYPCYVRHGNPNTSEFRWMRGHERWESQLLTLTDVSRNQSGIYTCTAQNTMMASDGDTTSGIDSGHLNVNVQCKQNDRRMLSKKVNIT